MIRQLIKLALAIGVLSFLSCSNNTERRLIGLWTIDSLDLRLTFYADSVLIISPLIKEKYAYYSDGSKIKIKNNNTENPDNIWTYKISSDSLFIWYQYKTWTDKDTTELLVYTKSTATNYYDHFLTKNNLNIDLPLATNSKEIYLSRSINIRIGYHNEQIKLFFDNNEVPFDELDSFLHEFTTNRQKENPHYYFLNFSYALFIDSDIPCEITLGLFPYLRKYGMRKIYFMTSVDKIDVVSEKFVGLEYFINHRIINIIEEKNAH